MPKIFRLSIKDFAPPVLMILVVVFLCADSVRALPLAQYRQNVHQATAEIYALQSAEEQSRSISQSFAVVQTIRKLLPVRQKIEIGNNADFETDNSWLETSLKNYEKTLPAAPERALILRSAADRLSAIEDRLKELETAQTVANAQNADKQKLDEILQRPEFQKPKEDKSILQQLADALDEWLSALFRRSPPAEIDQPQVDLSPVGAILNYVVIALAVAIIGFVAWRFLLPLVGNRSGRKKAGKKEPRIILGEQLAADATADDLLSQADRLAASGELRAAIRKGYISALCDLSDRKVLGLARHKTNRDYLRDVKKRDEIYQPMTGMTGIFERHWYGDVPPEKEDWQTFRGQLSIISQQSKVYKN